MPATVWTRRLMAVPIARRARSYLFFFGRTYRTSEWSAIS